MKNPTEGKIKSIRSIVEYICLENNWEKLLHQFTAVQKVVQKLTRRVQNSKIQTVSREPVMNNY